MLPSHAPGLDGRRLMLVSELHKTVQRGATHWTVQHILSFVATLLDMALKGARVYMGSRTERRATEAIKKLEDVEGVPKGSVIYHQVDLATVREAKSGAEEFLKREERWACHWSLQGINC